MSSIQTSVPPAYVEESAPTVVQVSKNNNAIKQPSEPKNCGNYILFVLIVRILYLIGKGVNLIAFPDEKYEYSLSITGMILLVIPITSSALGIMGVRRRSYAIFAQFLVLEMIWFIIKCKDALTSIDHYQWISDIQDSIDQDKTYAVVPILLLLTFSLGAILFFFIFIYPIFIYARFLRRKEVIRTFQKYINA